MEPQNEGTGSEHYMINLDGDYSRNNFRSVFSDLKPPIFDTFEVTTPNLWILTNDGACTVDEVRTKMTGTENLTWPEIM